MSFRPAIFYPHVLTLDKSRFAQTQREAHRVELFEVAARRSARRNPTTGIARLRPRGESAYGRRSQGRYQKSRRFHFTYLPLLNLKARSALIRGYRLAIARTDGGISRPSRFAALRLMTNSNFVGCSTGRSVGSNASSGFCPRSPRHGDSCEFGLNRKPSDRLSERNREGQSSLQVVVCFCFARRSIRPKAAGKGVLDDKQACRNRLPQVRPSSRA